MLCVSCSMQSVKRLSMFIVFFIVATPFFTHAATLEVSGWIPYWRSATGTADTRPNLNKLSEISPFVYSIKKDGTLLDSGKVTEEPWVSFIAQARAQKVKVIPTVMTSNGALVHEILKDPKKRLAHINNIQQMVRSNNFDGVDIDYEGKLAETNPHFTLFLKGLAKAFPDKLVVCTIESRIPEKDRFTVIPKKVEYANDFKAINKYCDRVRIMVYDQQTIDQTLNKQHEKEVYIPLADNRWVEKAVRFAMKDISPKKIVLGVPTYGHEYQVTAYADGFVYKKLWSFNPSYAVDIARSLNIAPTRTVGGELQFSYVPTTTPSGAPNASFVPNSNSVAAVAFALASSTNTNHTFNVLWWSDAEAIRSKYMLSQKLGVRGVAVFKFDGGQDPLMWSVFPAR